MLFSQNTNIDNSIASTGLPVCVAAVFNTLGDFKPVHICIEDLYGNVCKTKVEQIKNKKNVRGGVAFCCTYRCGDTLRELVLIYYINDHIWVIEN